MENTKTGLSIISKPIGFSETTGMNVYQSYTAGSGFNYMVGMREINDILIVEKIAEGTACTLLCGILIYHKKTKELLKEIEVERNIYYTRAKTMELVRESLVDVLLDACNKNAIDVDINTTNKHVTEMLDKCYFEKSRKSIIEWAISYKVI